MAIAKTTARRHQDSTHFIPETKRDLTIRLTPGLLNCLLEMGEAIDNSDGLDEILMECTIPSAKKRALMDRIQTYLGTVEYCEVGPEAAELAELLISLSLIQSTILARMDEMDT